MFETVDLIASYRPRPTKNVSTSADVYHVADGLKTLCGVSAEGWMLIERREVESALQSAYLCKRCAAKLRQ
jgi:hypothetical protein